MQPVKSPDVHAGPDFGVVILAAGASSRMGQPKQLMPYEGKPLLRHAVEVALAAEVREVIVVLGCRAEMLEEALQDLPVRIVHNPDWEDGMGTSIRAGVAEADRLGLEGVILSLADQPLVGTVILNTLLAWHSRAGSPIVTAEYADTVGVPVFFARSHFPQLLELQPSQGCKGVILKNASDALRIAVPEAAIDVDTPEDFARVTERSVVAGQH